MWFSSQAFFLFSLLFHLSWNTLLRESWNFPRKEQLKSSAVVTTAVVPTRSNLLVRKHRIHCLFFASLVLILRAYTKSFLKFNLTLSLSPCINPPYLYSKSCGRKNIEFCSASSALLAIALKLTFFSRPLVSKIQVNLSNLCLPIHI